MRRLATLSVVLIGLGSLSLATLGLAPGGHATAEAGGKNTRAAKRLTPKDEALVALGRRLFFDPLVSRSGARSCASCHDPDHGFSDPARVSDDDLGRTRRHSQTLLDSHLNPTAHWDGEFESVEELVLARIGAIKGRKGRLGHGVTLMEVVAQQLGDGESLRVEVTEDDENELIDDGEDPSGGDDGNSYDRGGEAPEGARARGPSSPSGAAPKGARGGPTPKKEQPAGGGCFDCGPRPEEPKVKDPSKAEGGGGSDEGKPDLPETGGGADGSNPYTGKKDDEPKDDPDADPKAKRDAEDANAKDRDAAKDEDAEPAKKTKLSDKELQRRAAELRRSLGKLPLAHEELATGGRYDEAFTAAFGNDKVNTTRIARAIAAYCRSLESTTSAYDRFVAGQRDALSESAKRGLDLFRGRAACAKCHTIDGEHPTFTDFAFHNTGVVWNGLSAKQRKQLAGHDQTFKRKHDDLEMPVGADEGRARRSTRKADLRSFKTPTLRDVAKRGPFMHDGRFKTLTSVVSYYARGASPDPTKASHVKAFTASKQDVADLVAFMESLSGDERPGLPAKAWRERAPKTRLRLVDAGGKAMANLTVNLSPVGDLAHAKAGYAKMPGSRKTDANGWVEFTNRRTTHTRITLPGGLIPLQGALIPDSCREAKLVVPVRGRTEIVVRFPAGAKPPAVLAADHLGTFVLPGHDIPRSRFTRGEVLKLGRSHVVRYSGWMRTDVPATVRMHVPGLAKARAEVVLDRAKPVRLDLTQN